MFACAPLAGNDAPLVATSVSGLSGLRAAAVSPTSIALSWQGPSWEVRTLTVERRLAASRDYALVATLSPGLAQWTDDGLAPSTFYYYRVQAQPADPDQAGAPSVVAARTFEAASTVPVSPASLVATAGEAEISLAWDDRATDERAYLVERDDGAGFVGIASREADATGYRDGRVTRGKVYRYRVVATNGAGRSAPSKEVTASIGAGAVTQEALIGAAQGFGSYATSLAVAGSRAFVTDLDLGLAVVDVADPSAPALQATSLEVYDANGVALAGNVAYVAAGDYGLVRADVDPASPAYLQRTGLVSNNYAGRARRLALVGRHAYVANGALGLGVVDVGVSPEAPMSRIGVLGTPGQAVDVVVEGTRAYVAMGTAGVLVADVSNPAAPAEITTLTWSGRNGAAIAGRVAVDGGRLYVSLLYDGLVVYDVSGPLPVRLGAYVNTKGVEGVVAAGGRTYALTTDGFERLDLSDPASIRAVRSVSLGAMPHDGVLVGDLLHLAVATRGLAIYRVP